MIAPVKTKRKHPKIVKEFRDILFELNDTEFANLEADILARGILHPIFVWDNICIDGMHRLAIAKKHNLKYTIKHLKFNSKEEAKAYVFEHQASKRNQSTFSKISAGLQFEDYYKQLAKENQKKSPGRGKKGLTKIVKKVDTTSILSKKIGVARSYITNVKYIIDNGNKDTIAKCHRGELSIRNAYLKSQYQARKKRRQKEISILSEYKNPKGEYINQIINGDCLKVMRELSKAGLEGEISNIIFSPNYNNDCNYGNGHNDDIPYKKYIDFLGKVFLESYKLLRTGGRLIVQIDSMTNRQDEDKGDSYKRTIYPDLVYKIRQLNEEHNTNLKFFTEICWYKQNGAGKKSAHGSYASCSCPVIKRTHEYILVWSKDQWQLPCKEGIESDITAEEFNKYVWSVWPVHPITQKNANHPCTFPEKLIQRIIKLMSYKGDIILDPFNGSGTTTAVANRLGRRYIGIEQNSNYCSYAKKRLKSVK